MKASRVSSSNKTNLASWMVLMAMQYSPGRYPGVSCSWRSASRSDSPAPCFTRKNKLNSLVGPAVNPGRGAVVSDTVTGSPLVASAVDGRHTSCALEMESLSTVAHLVAPHRTLRTRRQGGTVVRRCQQPDPDPGQSPQPGWVSR